MTRQEALERRRAANARLAQIDALNRCVVCKRDLAEAAKVFEDFLVPGKCCSDACLWEFLAQAQEPR